MFFGLKRFYVPVILGVLFLILTRVILETPWKLRAENLDITGPTTGVLGELLLTEYLLPFEVISVMLLAGLVGAVVLIRKEVNKAGREERM